MTLQNLQTRVNQITQDQLKSSLDRLFNPFVRVIPSQDWLKIEAIWIPLLHHDHDNVQQRSQIISIFDSVHDRFGSIKGNLSAPHENYIPYITTFFAPELDVDHVLQLIAQAAGNIIEIQCIAHDADGSLVSAIVIGQVITGMLLQLKINNQYQIIDAAPVFQKSS